MSKRLIIILALVLVAGFACAAYAEVQNVKVSGDITTLGISRKQFGLNKSAGLKAENALASIVRLRVDADLTDNVVATIRLLNERYWGRERELDNGGASVSNGASGVNSNIDLDLAYVTLREFLYSPLTLTVGRQELHFGNDMIVGDPDTNNAVTTASPFSTAGGDPDLSARKSFDAIRATLNYDPLVIDAIYAKVRERTTRNNDDENLYGVNASYALNKTTTVEGYLFVRDVGKKAYATTTTTNARCKGDKTYVPGVRLVTAPIENLTYQVEIAGQLGKYNWDSAARPNQTISRRAFAAETFLTYDFKKQKYTPSVTAMYGYFSGPRGNDTKVQTAWDPMYENQTAGHIVNTLLNQTNCHIVGLTGSLKPVDDLTLKGEYYALWWDKKWGDGQVGATVKGDSITLRHKKFIGSEVDLKAVYDYTEDVQFGLLCGMLFPGNSLDESNRSMASEVIGSMKVTF